MENPLDMPMTDWQFRLFQETMARVFWKSLRDQGPPTFALLDFPLWNCCHLGDSCVQMLWALMCQQI
jgi:hypothetical protein